jgi:hypothetical protein
MATTPLTKKERRAAKGKAVKAADWICSAHERRKEKREQQVSKFGRGKTKLHALSNEGQ